MRKRILRVKFEVILSVPAPEIPYVACLQSLALTQGVSAFNAYIYRLYVQVYSAIVSNGF